MGMNHERLYAVIWTLIYCILVIGAFYAGIILHKRVNEIIAPMSYQKCETEFWGDANFDFNMPQMSPGRLTHVKLELPCNRLN
jgi:hypothetical protein